MKPLADLIRPKQLSEVFGQEHILGENKSQEKYFINLMQLMLH